MSHRVPVGASAVHRLSLPTISSLSVSDRCAARALCPSAIPREQMCRPHAWADPWLSGQQREDFVNSFFSPSFSCSFHFPAVFLPSLPLFWQRSGLPVHFPVAQGGPAWQTEASTGTSCVCCVGGVAGPRTGMSFCVCHVGGVAGPKDLM